MLDIWNPTCPIYSTLGRYTKPLFLEVLNSSPVINSIAKKWSIYGQDLLSWYNPLLEPSQRQNQSYPLMDPLHMAFAVTTYLCIIGLVLLIHKIKAILDPKSVHQTYKNGQTGPKRVLDKIGPVFLIQALYNILQVYLCGYVVVRVIQTFIAENYSLVCNSFNEPNTEMAKITWFFYVLKYIDLMDTAFMVLRGNMRQVSFLHVFHHSSVIYIFWVNASVGYDGEIYFVVLFNAFVHVIMYSYYFLSSFNIGLSKWIKPLVTRLQLLQFACMIIHGLYHIMWGDVLHAKSSCKYPTRIAAGYLAYVAFLFLLFRQFSIKTYRKSDKKDV